jgi:hypothetical protein
MPLPTCPSCKQTVFDTKVLVVTSPLETKAFTVIFCTSCGTVVGGDPVNTLFGGTGQNRISISFLFSSQLIPSP